MGKEGGLSIAALPLLDVHTGRSLNLQTIYWSTVCAVFCVFFCGSAPVDYECHSMHR